MENPVSLAPRIAFDWRAPIQFHAEASSSMLDRPNSRAGWLARAAALNPEGRAFIDGAYTPALGGATFARISPIDGRVFAHVADCGEADIDRAVRAGRRAFESGVWRDVDPQRKKAVLLRFAELIRENVDEI